MSISQSSPPVPAKPIQRPRLVSLLSVGFVVVLLVVLGLAAWSGYRAGLTVRDDQFRATQASDLQAQFDLGLADLAAQRYRMASARFEYILSQDPNYPQARERLAEAQAALDVTPTTVPATAPPSVGEDPAALLALAETYSKSQNWDEVIAQISHLRALDRTYESLKVDELLYSALRGRGVARIQGDEMEAGIFDLDQAAAFGPLDAEARNYRAWARLYLAARSYWGLDWARTVGVLSDLYLIAPNFKGTSGLYHEALLNYANQLNAAGDPCGAAANYEAALQLTADPAVSDQLNAAQASCALTPTPEASATPEPGAEAITPTP